MILILTLGTRYGDSIPLPSNTGPSSERPGLGLPSGQSKGLPRWWPRLSGRSKRAVTHQRWCSPCNGREADLASQGSGQADNPFLSERRVPVEDVEYVRISLEQLASEARNALLLVNQTKARVSLLIFLCFFQNSYYNYNIILRV